MLQYQGVLNSFYFLTDRSMHLELKQQSNKVLDGRHRRKVSFSDQVNVEFESSKEVIIITSLKLYKITIHIEFFTEFFRQINNMSKVGRQGKSYIIISIKWT